MVRRVLQLYHTEQIDLNSEYKIYKHEKVIKTIKKEKIEIITYEILNISSLKNISHFL